MGQCCIYFHYSRSTDIMKHQQTKSIVNFRDMTEITDPCSTLGEVLPSGNIDGYVWHQIVTPGKGGGGYGTKRWHVF